MQLLPIFRLGRAAIWFSKSSGIDRSARECGLSMGFALLAACCFPFQSATAATLPAVTVAWNPNPEKDIASYELAYGTTSGKYGTRLKVGHSHSATVSGLTAGVKYYFVVYAYNRAGLKSPPSSEIVYQGSIPTTNRAPNGWITSPSTGGSIVAGRSVEFAAGGNDPDGTKPLAYRWNFGAGSGIPDSFSANPGAVVFKTPGTYQVTLTVTDSKGVADPKPDVRTITVVGPWTEIPRTGWKLEYVNSEEPDGFAATRSFDGDPTTFWHTRFRAAHLPPPPHEIQLDLGASRLLKGFEYLPRQDGITVGDIGRFAFYVSKDGKKWGKPVATGKFSTSPVQKRVLFKPVNGRYVRLVSLAEANGATDCNVAELNILQGPPANRKPVAKARSVSTSKNKPVAITLGGGDADQNPLTYQIVAGPSHGKLSGLPPDLTYAPAKGYSGPDFFTYRIKDGLSSSKTVKVAIQVKPGGSSRKSAPLAAAIAGGITPEGRAAGAETFGIRGFSAVPSAPPKTGSVMIGGLKYLTLTVTKPAVPDGVKRSVQVSPNLVDWFSGANHVTIIEDNERFLKVRDNTPLTPGARRYIRLKTKRK